MKLSRLLLVIACAHVIGSCGVTEPEHYVPLGDMRLTSTYPWFGFEGSTVVIGGENFGEEIDSVTVTIGGDTALVKEVNNHAIVVVLPMGARGSGLNVRRRQRNRSESNTIDFLVAPSRFRYTQALIATRDFREVRVNDTLLPGGVGRLRIDTALAYQGNNYSYALYARGYKCDTLSNGDTVRIARFQSLGGTVSDESTFGYGYAFERVTIIIDTLRRALRRIEITTSSVEHWQVTDSTSSTGSSSFVFVLADVPYQHRDNNTLVAYVEGEDLRMRIVRYESSANISSNPVGKGFVQARRSTAPLINPTTSFRIELLVQI